MVWTHIAPKKMIGSDMRSMVELRGVEPLSENALTGTSPGADSHLHSLTQAWADTLKGLVESLCMVRSTLCARTDATKRRPHPARGPSGGDGRGLKPQRELRYRCSLIYKLPIFRMLGASARYSRLHVPVETGTAPNGSASSHSGLCARLTCKNKVSVSPAPGSPLRRSPPLPA